MTCPVCDNRGLIICPQCHGDGYYECKYGCHKTGCPEDGCVDGQVECPEAHGERTIER